jgi:ubiquinol-cytochrome c reductase cytochrome c1 subunit
VSRTKVMMTKIGGLVAALTVAASLALGAAPAVAQEHETVHFETQSWTFGGVFGTYDTNQLRRGFQIFREVCASCHSARLISFRTLAEEGGPHFSEEQVKALAAEYMVADAEAEGGSRAGTPADRWPSPFATAQDARDANGGAIPPDFSVLAKARSIATPFPWWIVNYFTAYQEGGPDYIYNLLHGYHEAPADFELPEGKYYNAYFPGQAIGMAPPLADGLVTYEGEGVPMTLDQYSRDISAFMMWLADPHMVERKHIGFIVIMFLILFSGLMYLTKNRIWRGVEH